MEDKMEGQVQTQWNWYIAVYLFLAGVGAGGYATGVITSYGGPEWEPVAKTGVALGFPLLLVGTLFLILDLGVKMRALRVFLNPGTSWIARGSLIISVFMILSFLHLVLMVWPGRMAIDSPLLSMIGVVNLVFSILVMIYTGVLLGAARPIAFWNTAMLPILFLISASSTGIMGVTLLTPSSPALSGLLRQLSRVDLFLLVLECIVIAIYLQASHRTDESRASASLLLKGRLAWGFWFGLIGLGLLVPLSLDIIEVSIVTEGDHSSTLWLTRTASVMGLLGGLILRRLVLAAGIRAPLRAAGIEFQFPSPTV
jgi:formate-dependent nitrite reductase membrane component NrfD